MNAHARFHAEHGEFSFVKMLAALLLIGLAMFEAGAIGVNRIQLDDIAGKAIRAAARAYQDQSSRSPAAVTVAVEGSLADHPQVRLVDVAVDPEGVSITISRTAPVLVVDRIGPLADWAEAEVSKHAARQ